MTAHFRRWVHLTARFFDVASARSPLTPAEQAEVEHWLRPAETALFFDQMPADQRHGLSAARWVEARAPGRPDLVRAALVHDVAKRHARMGVIARVLASLCLELGIPVKGRYAVYRDHPEIGARELEELGAEPIVVSFARHHHGPAPAGFPIEEWTLLREADKVRPRVVDPRIRTGEHVLTRFRMRQP